MVACSAPAGKIIREPVAKPAQSIGLPVFLIKNRVQLNRRMIATVLNCFQTINLLFVS